MRYCLIAALFVVGGCGSVESYDSARSLSETIYFLEKHNGLLSEDAVGENPYDNDPQYKMVYCQSGNIQYWSTEAACIKSDGKPQG